MSFCFSLQFERGAFYLFFITMDGLEKETVGKMVFSLHFILKGKGWWFLIRKDRLMKFIYQSCLLLSIASHAYTTQASAIF